MSKSPKIRLECLPKRDALTRLRAAYACLDKDWQKGRRIVDRQPASQAKQEEAS